MSPTPEIVALGSPSPAIEFHANGCAWWCDADPIRGRMQYFQ